MQDTATSPAAGADWADWVGRTETAHEVIAPDRVAALAATLDLDGVPHSGTLPPGWHWIFFNPFVRRSGLGTDGHPKRGGFLPPVPLPRRMWAGGRLHYLAPIPLGAPATRHSEIVKVTPKPGKRGLLVFVTVRHTLTVAGTERLVEEQDIVYREAPPPGAAEPVAAAAAPDAHGASEPMLADPTLLFRYSALTGNGHRIHYDLPYATGEEGYPGLVVHGPLLATLLQNLAARLHPARAMTRFEFRGAAPVFAGAPFHVEAEAAPAEPALRLWIRNAAGGLAMTAAAEFQPG